MEKETQPDSISAITVKPDYPPSEIYSSVPPPAYQRPQSSMVQVTKIIAVAVIIVSFVLGSFLLASAYVTATASCRQVEHTADKVHEASEKLPVSPEALVQERPSSETHNDVSQAEDSHSVDENNMENSEENENESSESDETNPIPFRLDLQDFVDSLLKKNQKSHMNCVIDKKRLVEIMEKQDNNGDEKVVVSCESEDEEKESPSEERFTFHFRLNPDMPGQMPAMFFQQLRPVLPPQQHRMRPNAMPSPVVLEIEDQNQFPSDQILFHIAQDIISQNMMENQRPRRPQMETHQRPTPDLINHSFIGKILQSLNKIPIPEPPMPQKFMENPQYPRKMFAEVHEQRTAPQEMIISPNVDTSSNVPDSQQMPTLQKMNIIPHLQIETVEETAFMQQPKTEVHEMNPIQNVYNKNGPIRAPLRLNQIHPMENGNLPPQEMKFHYVQPRSASSMTV